MRRGDIWWADLGEPRGSSPALRRPVVIVQDDLLTQSALGTIMVVPLTTNQRRARAIGNVALRADATGLPHASVALVCQVLTVDKAVLSKRVGAVEARSLRVIDAGLKLALGLA
jgi:mRNA interferase MazF